MLIKLIKEGPEINGFCSGCWNSAMVQELIKIKFGVLYSVKYVANLLHNLGFSYQKAKFESCHLNPEDREKWLQQTFPKAFSLAKRRNALLLFGDECSFPMWGSLSYTWGERGVQPLIKTSGKRTACKVFGAIDYFTGKFFSKIIKEKFNSESYIGFVKEIFISTKKHIILIQDGARYHTSAEVSAFFKNNKDRITIFQMPSYSPDYNPIEILWKKVKKEGVHLRYFPTIETLVDSVQCMLSFFKCAKDEVLKVFGFYTKLGYA